MRQEAGAKAGLFACVVDAHAQQAERRARLLRWVPLMVALHLLAVALLAPERRKTARLPVRAGDDDSPVLTLLAARPALPPAAAPTPAAAPRVLARKAPALPKPVLTPRTPRDTTPPPPPQDIPEVPEALASPADTSEAVGEALPSSTALDSASGAAVGAVVGNVMRGVIAGSTPPPPPPLTPEEREEWIQRYMELVIRDRFMDVRYPHLAAAAGITGLVTLRVTLSAQGRVLNVERIGRCPHPVLCEAAQEAVREAEPFPPPPRELGNPFELELPFRYHLH